MTDGQWANLKELTADNPDAALKQEIESKQFGPRTSDFLQRRVNFDSLKFMAATGDMPDGDLVDMASPSMVQFTQTANEMQSFLKTIDATTGGSMSQVFGIDSLAKKNQILRKLSAEAMIAMLTNPGAATPGSVTTPYAGKPQPQQGAPNAAASPGKPVSKPSIGPTGNRAGYGNPWEDPNAERGGYEQPRSRIPGHQD
jgi:hypothetical protein